MTGPEKTSIRKVKTEEIAIIHQLALDIWPKAFEEILTPEQTGYMLAMMYAPAVLKNEMERGVEYYILNHSGADIGYTAIEQKDQDSWKLHKIYLSQKMHGKGLGKFQLQYMETVVKKRGARYLYLNVNRRNKAVGFYRSQGYEVVKTEDIDIGRGFFMNDYQMRKPL